MGLAQEENLVVFYIRLPRETERLRGKKWVNARRSSPKPAVGNREHGSKDKEQASSSVP